ncbi:hypothetical protein AgCh_015608 [Apium graveolens]
MIFFEIRKACIISETVVDIAKAHLLQQKSVRILGAFVALISIDIIDSSEHWATDDAYVKDVISPKDPKTIVVEEKEDKLALAAIYQAIPEDILISLADKETAKEAWEAIKVMCEGAECVQTEKVRTLKTEFESLVMKETYTIDDFSMKLAGLVTNIRALGEEIAESYVVKKLLRVVPTKFLQISSSIEHFGNLDTMTFEETVGSLKAHGERLKGSTDRGGNQLLLTREQWIEREKDESKHYAIECRKPKYDKDVKEEAHMAQIPDEEPVLLLAEFKKNEKKVFLINEKQVKPKLSQGDVGSQMESNMWYLDNEASNHMIGQLSKFDKLDKSVMGQVKFGDGSVVQIKGKSCISLKCKNGEIRTLNKVYFIPSLRINIISLGQLAEEGYNVTSRGDYLWVREQEGNFLMKVKRSTNRLYKIIIYSSDLQFLISRCEDESWLWHSRLSHVNFKAMKSMSTDNMVLGIPVMKQPKEV